MWVNPMHSELRTWLMAWSSERFCASVVVSPTIRSIVSMDLSQHHTASPRKRETNAGRPEMLQVAAVPMNSASSNDVSEGI